METEKLIKGPDVLVANTLKIIPALIFTVLGLGHADAQPASADVARAERDILTEFFAATGGERWTRREGWGTSASVCEWYGVFCDFADANPSRPFVAGLSLALNYLTGRIPSSVAGLTRLRNAERNI